MAGKRPAERKGSTEVATTRHAEIADTTGQVAKQKFLDTYRQLGNVSAAARAAGVRRQTPYEWEKVDTEFSEAWKAAHEDALDRLHQEAFRRAVVGTDEPYLYEGRIAMQQRRNADGSLMFHPDTREPLMEPITTKRFSDRLLAFLLEHGRPEVYRRRMALEGPGGGPVPVMPVLPGGGMPQEVADRDGDVFIVEVGGGRVLRSLAPGPDVTVIDVTPEPAGAEAAAAGGKRQKGKR